MTEEKFSDMSFSAGMIIQHRDGRQRMIIAIDFQEALFGVREYPDDDELTYWRCENVEVI